MSSDYVDRMELVEKLKDHYENAEGGILDDEEFSENEEVLEGGVLYGGYRPKGAKDKRPRKKRGKKAKAARPGKKMPKLNYQSYRRGLASYICPDGNPTAKYLKSEYGKYLTDYSNGYTDPRTAFAFYNCLPDRALPRRAIKKPKVKKRKPTQAQLAALAKGRAKRLANLKR